MTIEERVRAIADFGFTARQARFLELVMRHSGVCVPRQYARFAGIAHGSGKCNRLFEKLVWRGCAVRWDCLHNRAGLYHIHHRPLYQAIGEGESRFRRAMSPRRAIERLMLLDAVLASPDLTWLSNGAEKVAYLAALEPRDTTADSSESVDETSPSNPGHPFTSVFPIGIDATGHAVLFFLVLAAATDEFRSFLHAHAAFLHGIPSWTLRLVFPRPLDRVYHAYQQVIRDELETPLHPGTIAELKWYFTHRQQAADGPVHPTTRAFLDRGAQSFSSPRFAHLYRRWQKQGGGVLDELSSAVLSEKLASGSGRVESLVLPHTYRHLAPAASLVRSVASGVEEGDTEGDKASARPQPPASTRLPEPLSISEQLERDWYRLVGRS